jgi:hypothetical protein
MRQRLQRIVQIHARQRGGQTPVLPAHAFGIDDEQRRAVAQHQMAHRLRRKRILGGIELQCLVAARIGSGTH